MAENKIVYGYGEKDIQRVNRAVLLSESAPLNEGGQRRQRHFKGGGKAKYNGYLKVIDISADGTYEVQIVDGLEITSAVAGRCQINGAFKTIGELTEEVDAQSGFIYLQWDWNGVTEDVDDPTLIFRADNFPPYTADSLIWPLAWVYKDTDNETVIIQQLWLGGYFQANLWGEC